MMDFSPCYPRDGSLSALPMVGFYLAPPFPNTEILVVPFPKEISGGGLVSLKSVPTRAGGLTRGPETILLSPFFFILSHYKFTV